MPLAPGTRLGPYEIVEPIGAGGMGEVYRAKDSRLGRNVAIKISLENFTEHFEREAQSIAALNHPNICHLYDVGPNYLVMEYIEGTPLKGPLPLDQALKHASQICDALDAAHQKGITHRDLKPGNVLVTPAGIKLLDFGLAKVDVRGGSDETATQTQAGMVVGTASYMSPEQAQGRPVDQRSDIFSFGAVLYELLAGRRAFRGDSTVSTLASILRDEPSPVDTSPEIQAVLARCLRKQPADRFQTAAELKAALEQAARTCSRAERTPSIAVLPFANLSADKDNEYFGDGLAEEILNALTQLPGLRVIARASAFSFRGRENAIAEIGEKLQVTSVLHGSVRRSGNRIRVSAQLVNVGDESQLWSERYDREMHDVFDIQDEIAQAIVAQLKVKLNARSGRPLVKRHTENLEAHSLYLRGNFHVHRLRNEELERGREYLEKAVALDPLYAPALFELGGYYIAIGHRGGALPLDQWPKVRRLAAKALEADPEFAEAHAALGLMSAYCDFRWEDAIRELDGALQLNPASALAHFWRSNVLFILGRGEAALTAIGRAVELDPLLALFHTYGAIYSLLLGRPGQAIESARRSLDVDPDFPVGIQLLGEACSLLGRHEEGAALIEKTLAGVPAGSFYSALLAWVYVRSGRRQDAERLRATLEEAAKAQYVPAGTRAFVAAALEDAESALPLLEESVRERDPNVPLWIGSHYFQTLHGSARFDRLLRSLNLGR
jgi:eukaryotic-like serine/threonine-protein kinase